MKHRRRLGRATIPLVAAAAAGLWGAEVVAEPSEAAQAGRVALIDAIATGPSVEERLAEIRERIQRSLVYPPIARRRGLEGMAQLRFRIDRDGRARDVEMARSSGHWLLDRAAGRAVRDAGRLPWVYGRLEVPIRFALE